MPTIFHVLKLCLGTAAAGIRKKNHQDLTLITLPETATVAGVFTQNRFCAAPVQVCKKHLKKTNGKIRALVINTGIANAGTGEIGLQAAKKTCAAAAQLLNIQESEVLPFSTGVILEHLPVERLIAALPNAKENLNAQNWENAAHAIMTTDTRAKIVSQEVAINGQKIHITGIAKGAGMIHPNMATMLGFVALDAAVSPALLQKTIQEAAAQSFNAISVDGDTSTNDSFILMATGALPLKFETGEEDGWQELKNAIHAVSLQLAKAIVQDGEGATKFITIDVSGGNNEAECQKIARAIAHSPLVKTAFFASDPNLGRILAAIGYAGIDDLNVAILKVYLDDVLVAENGGRASNYQEEDGKRVMAKSEITIGVELNRGKAHFRLYTCDLSHDYVSINADYRS